jgi:hypothetical protein
MNSLLSKDVGSEEDNNDGNNVGGDGDVDDCADGDDNVDIVIVVDVDNRSDDNGYSIGIILV